MEISLKLTDYIQLGLICVLLEIINLGLHFVPHTTFAIRQCVSDCFTASGSAVSCEMISSF